MATDASLTASEAVQSGMGVRRADRETRNDSELVVAGCPGSAPPACRSCRSPPERVPCRAGAAGARARMTCDLGDADCYGPDPETVTSAASVPPGSARASTPSGDLDQERRSATASNSGAACARRTKRRSCRFRRRSARRQRRARLPSRRSARGPGHALVVPILRRRYPVERATRSIDIKRARGALHA